MNALRGRRAAQRREFLEQPGRKLVIAVPGEPLFPQRLDPLNVHIVAQGEVLHTRFIHLGNETGEIEVLGRTTLTEAAGEHPLFDGMHVVTVTGLANKPVIAEANGIVTVEADGISAELRGATVDIAWQTITIRMRFPPCTGKTARS